MIMAESLGEEATPEKGKGKGKAPRAAPPPREPREPRELPAPQRPPTGAAGGLEAALAKRKEHADLYVKTNLDVEMSNIRDRFWLGNSVDAANADLLQGHGITHILNCARDVPTPSRSAEFAYLRLDLDDAEDAKEDLLEVLRAGKAFDFVEEGLEKGGILIHCQLGRSRSASVLVGYMMCRLNCPYVEAIAEVKSKRKLYGGDLVAPNSGFHDALLRFDRELRNDASGSPA